VTVLEHPSAGRLVVGPIAPERAFTLRHEVLRPHQPLEEMATLDSAEPEAVVIGAVDASGEVVATGTVSPHPAPEGLEKLLGMTGAAAALGGSLAGLRAWRLRGMATRPDLRGGGVGTAVLGALLDHVADHGGGVLWCNARTSAVAFYERAAFRQFGDVWVDVRIGPHALMWRVVEPVR